MVYVVAELMVAAGKRDEFLTLFNALVPDVRAEEGCIEYFPTVDVETDGDDDPRSNVVTVLEKWGSAEALEKHHLAPHMLKFREEAKELMLGSQIRVLEEPGGEVRGSQGC